MSDGVGQPVLLVPQARDVISFIHQDYDTLWEKIEHNSPELFMAWRDCGFLDQDGKERPAYRVWRKYLDLPLRN